MYSTYVCSAFFNCQMLQNFYTLAIISSGVANKRLRKYLFNSAHTNSITLISGLYGGSFVLNEFYMH